MPVEHTADSLDGHVGPGRYVPDIGLFAQGANTSFIPASSVAWALKVMFISPLEPAFARAIPFAG